MNACIVITRQRCRPWVKSNNKSAMSFEDSCFVRGGLRVDSRFDLSEENLIQPLNEAVKLAESVSGVDE